MSKSGIHINPAHKGELHRKLGVPQGQAIPEAKIQQALHSSNPSTRKQAQFAENAKHFDHSHGHAVKSAIAKHGKS